MNFIIISETVEPIAGISKHTRMTVISYSAEGATFTDRDTYPYFFRTIGSNRQYEKVFMDLFKRLKWRRVAALTEDGQKYTEYISHMETIMKQENMELILNKKFTKDVSQSGMRRVRHFFFFCQNFLTPKITCFFFLVYFVAFTGIKKQTS